MPAHHVFQRNVSGQIELRVVNVVGRSQPADNDQHDRLDELDRPNGNPHRRAPLSSGNDEQQTKQSQHARNQIDDDFLSDLPDRWVMAVDFCEIVLAATENIIQRCQLSKNDPHKLARG